MTMAGDKAQTKETEMEGNVQSWERQARRKQPTRVIPHHGKLFKQQEKKKEKKTTQVNSKWRQEQPRAAILHV